MGDSRYRGQMVGSGAEVQGPDGGHRFWMLRPDRGKGMGVGVQGLDGGWMRMGGCGTGARWRSEGWGGSMGVR